MMYITASLKESFCGERREIYSQNGVLPLPPSSLALASFIFVAM
jgi:hypothetical protein